MTWVIFDASDRQTTAPEFDLEQAAGGRQALRDFHGRANLILLFLHGPDRLGNPCPHCQEALAGFARHQEDYRSREAQILAFLPQPSGGYPGHREDGAALLFPAELPFPLLWDPGGAIRRAYASLMVSDLVPPDSALLFVLDNFAGLYAACITLELDTPQIHAEAQSWLDYIGMQCPE